MTRCDVRVSHLAPCARGRQGQQRVGEEPDAGHHPPRAGRAEPVGHLAREVDADEAVEGDARHGEGGDDSVGVEKEGEDDAHVVPEHLQKVAVGISAGEKWDKW